MATQIYAAPRVVNDPKACTFYHTMDVPGHGLVQGQWDLRGGVERYLGGVGVNGKRVLDVGTASGFLTFTLERLGAQVVSYDLSENDPWDVVPYAGAPRAEDLAERRETLRKINNAYWFCHRRFNSNAKMVYGTVYAIPPQIGRVDISIVGAILIHLRDPFLALQNVLRLTRETAVVVEPMTRRQFARRWLTKWLGPRMIFRPDFRTGQPSETWWWSSPEAIREILGVMGFERSAMTYHWHPFGHEGRKFPFYTIVAHRTRDVA